MSDERQSKPSASSMERYQLCPGSWRAEQGQPDETTDDAETGNRIHAALAGEAVTLPLTDDEERVVEACRTQAAALIIATVGEAARGTLERRIWSLDEQWSGKPDVVALAVVAGERHAIVIDYKTGRGDVTDATGNMQLRALAVLVADQHWADRVTVAIVQPLAGPVSTCVYDSAALDTARSEITGIIDAIQKPDAPRIPSAKACKYCKAKGVCPEAHKLAADAPLAVSRDGRELSISPERMAEFLEQVPAIEAVVEAVRAKAKRMLQDDPESVPGWKLKPGAERESITDPTTVFNRASALGVNAEAFIGCVSVAKGKLKDAVKAATGDKGKALDARLETVLAGCTETKATAPSLVKIKEGA
jgi:CRISPR/Cas system-associated exonuclease Cas4 (RecB family)